MPVLVRFDEEYAYGDANDAWEALAKSIGGSGVPVLLGDVSIDKHRRQASPPSAAPLLIVGVRGRRLASARWPGSAAPGLALLTRES